jgi:site-specific DNA-methyltransferase (cytosine-N4-specific)
MLQRFAQLDLPQDVTTTIEMRSAAESWPLDTASINLIVTSPPYPNSYDYYLYHKLRFFWLGYGHKEVQQKELGSRNRHSDLGEALDTYLVGMRRALVEMRRVLAPHGGVCIVVGDSIIRGDVLDMERAFRDLAGDADLECVRVVSFNQRQYSTSFVRNIQRPAKRSHILFLEGR